MFLGVKIRDMALEKPLYGFRGRMMINGIGTAGNDSQTRLKQIEKTVALACFGTVMTELEHIAM